MACCTGGVVGGVAALAIVLAVALFLVFRHHSRAMRQVGIRYDSASAHAACTDKVNTVGGEQCGG